jgi:hypothetical protein
MSEVDDEYDFTGAERGKFYRKGAVFIPPVQLEPAVLRFILKRAQAKGATVDELVNELLKKDIELIEAAS